MKWIVSGFSFQLETHWLRFQRERMLLAPVKKGIGAIGRQHQLCKLSWRCCKHIWHCPLKPADVTTKSFTLETRGTPLFDSLCTFSPFCFLTWRANSCNINHGLLMGKSPSKWQPVIKMAIGKVYVFSKMNEWNQMARWLCSGAFTQGWVTSVLLYCFLMSPPLLLHSFSCWGERNHLPPYGA